MQRLVEDLAGLRKKMPPEGAAAAYSIFPQPRQGLVYAQRRRLAQRRAVMLGIEPLLIKAVPQLVQQAEERFGEVVLPVTRGDPRIARADGAEEGVRCGVQSPSVEIKAEGRS